MAADGIIDPFKPAAPAGGGIVDPFKAAAPSAPAAPAPTLQQPRSFGRAIGDLGVGLAEGAMSAGLAVPQIANTVTGGAVDKYIWNPLNAGIDSALGGPGVGSSLAESSQDSRQFLDTLKSPQLRAQEQDLAATKGFLPSAKKILTNPMLLSQQVAEQVPQFLVPAGAARKVGALALEKVAGEALTKGVAKRVANGVGAEEAARLTMPAAQRLGERAASKAAGRSVMATGGAIGASQASEQAQQEVLGLDQKVLDANPQYQQMRAQGMSDADARQQLAITAGVKAAAIALPLDTLASGLTARLEGNIFRGETGVHGVGQLLTRRGLAGVAKTAGKEGVEEGLQEGGEQFAQNVGVQGVDPNKSLMDQVPEQAALGGSIGLALGGAGFAGSSALSRPKSHAVPHPGAAPGSLSDAANVLSQPAAGPVGRAAQAAVVSGATAPAAAPVSATTTNSEPVPAPPAPRVDPGLPPWADPTTGELAKPTKGELTQALADHIVGTYQQAGHMRINTQEIADAWGVPKAEVNRVRQRATKLATDQVAAAEREAMNPTAPRSFDEIAADIDATHAAASDRLNTALGNTAEATPNDNERVPVAAPAAEVGAGAEAAGPADAQPAAVGDENGSAAAEEPAPGSATAVAGDGATTDTLAPLTTETTNAEAPGQTAAAPGTEGQPAGVAGESGSAAAGSAGQVAQGAPQEAAATENPVTGQPAAAEPAPAVTPAEKAPRATASGGAGSANSAPTSQVHVALQKIVGGDHPGEVLSQADEPTVRAVAKALGRRFSDKAPISTIIAKLGADRADTTIKAAAALVKMGVAKAAEAPALAPAPITTKPATLSTAAGKAETLRVKTPDGEVNGRTHINQLVKRGFTQITSTRAGDKMVHTLSNAAGESEPIHARQLDYAREAVAKAAPDAATGKDSLKVAPQPTTEESSAVAPSQPEATPDRRTHADQRAAIDALPPEQSEVEKLRARVADLERERTTSDVTGLRNKRAFDDDAALGWPGVGAADMDGLKALNDTIGHEAADAVLKALGDHMRSLEGDGVRFYHRSGDEFAARFKDAAAGAETMRNLQDALEQVQVTLSDGTTTLVYDGIGLSVGHGETYEQADTAVNADKAARLASGKREQPRTDGRPGRLREDAAEGVQADQRAAERGPAVPEAGAGTGEESGRVDAAAAEAAAHPENDKPEPTAAQVAADNFAKGHLHLHGLDIAIEIPKGGIRRGVDAKGNAWERELLHHYGAIRGTTSADGENVDVYLGPHAEDASKPVFVIDQVKPGTKKFDESKVMLGYASGKEARAAYDSNFPKGLKTFGAIHTLSLDEFKTWLKDGDTKAPMKPVEANTTLNRQETPDSAVSKVPAKRGGIATNGARVRVVGGKLEYVPGAHETLQAYFKPDTLVHGSGGTTDKVLAFDWNGGAWHVKVKQVKADGSPLDDRSGAARERAHSTMPDRRELLAKLGKPELAVRAANPVNAKAAADESVASADTKDAGEELWANRRNSTGKGLSWNDIAELNDTLKAREAVKTKVWPRPDYEQLVDGGMPRPIAHIVKQIYDAVATKPQTRGAPSDADYRDYIDGMHKLRDATFDWAKRVMEQPSVATIASEVAAAPSVFHASNTLSKFLSLGGGESPILDAVFPQPAGGMNGMMRPNRFRSGEQGQVNNRLALLLGGNKMVKAIQPGQTAASAAAKAIADGWPASQESWQKRGFKVIPVGAGTVNEVTGIRGNGEKVTMYRPSFEGASILRNGSFTDKAEAQAFVDQAQPWALLDKGNRVVSWHASESEATDAARAQTATKTGGDGSKPEPPVALQNARTGPERRPAGKDVTSGELKDAFGFRGINFGNWMKGDGAAATAERQAHLNHAYDSFMDLADILHVPPKALSLNGTLGIAVGAQGKGGKKAAMAHFMPGVNEINLTRELGAGSLAHEWAHALDHYFASQAGGKVVTSEKPFLTEHLSSAALDGVRPEVRRAFKAIAQEMETRPQTEQEFRAGEAALTKRARDGLDGELKSLRTLLERGAKEDKSAAALAEFDQLAGQLRRGDIGEGYVKTGRGQFDSAPQVVGQIHNLIKDATGRKAPDVQHLSSWARMVSNSKTAEQSNAGHVPQSARTTSNFASEARKLEGTSAKPYWSTRLEMFARAFQSYVLDKLAAQDARNNYLTRPQATEEDRARMLADPVLAQMTEAGDRYPRGAERQAINKAFDTLVGDLKTETTEDGTVRLFSRDDAEKPALLAPQGGIEPTPGQNRNVGQAGFSADATRTPKEFKQFRMGSGEPAAVAGTTQQQAEHTAKVKAITDDLTKDWKGDDVPRVVVVATPEQLPAIAKRAANGLPSDAYKTASGMYDGKTVWVVASRHPDSEAGRAKLARTLAHEVIGHYGTERIVTRELGADAWTKIEDATDRLRQNPELASAGVRSVLDRLANDYAGIDRKTYAQEFLAVSAEKGVHTGLLDRAIAAIRRFIRKLFPDLRLSEHELRNLLVHSKEYIERGETQQQLVQSRAALAFSADGKPDTDTPAFQRFFGDSKVVDAAGAPLPVYHGTAEEFDTFDPQRSGSATAHMTANLGTFFAEDKAKAQHYAENASQGVPAEERVVDAYLSIQKPYPLSLKQFMDIDSREESQALREKLIKEGYDGIHIPDVGQWVAFHPNQIKSASENRGTFDSNSGNIYFSRDDADPDNPKPKPRPFGDASASIEAIHDTLPKLDTGNLQAVKDWIAGKARDLEPLALGGIQLRHVLELAAEDPTLKAPATSYADLYQRMDGDRNRMTMEGAAKVDALQKWARRPGLAGWLGKLRPEAAALFKFMHAVTQLAVDPTTAYEKLLMRDEGNEYKPWTKDLIKQRIKVLRETALTRSGDDKTRLYDEIKELERLPQRERVRQERYPQLVAQWNALSPEAKRHFEVMRDHYQEQSAALEEATIQQLKGLDIPDQAKRNALQMVRNNFQQAKVDGVYFPLTRFGDYWMSVRTKDGEYVFAKYENAQKFAEAEKRFLASGAEIEARGRQDNNYRAKDAPSGTFIGDLMGVLKSAPDQVKDEIYQMYLKTLPALSLRKHGIHRSNVAGYSDDVPRAFAGSVFHGAHQISKARYGWRLQATLEQMRERMEARRTVITASQAAHGDALLSELSRRHDWIMNPSNSQLANKLTSIGFSWFLAASPASALVNLIQVPQVVLPVLGARHGWGKASRMLGAAMRDAISTGGNIGRKLSGEDLLAFKALQEQGTFQRSATHALAGVSEGDQLRSSPAYTKVMNAVSWMFHTSEVINREGTGIAAFRLARSEGQSFDQALKYADEITNGTHGDYSNAGRARYMQGNVAKVALQFKNYSLAMSWLWGRNFYKAFKGESPEVKAVARRTLTGMLGMTGLFAGVIGMPIFNLLRYGAQALHAVTGDDDEPWDFVTEFRSWLAEHLGQEAADIIAGGAASQLGANVASRVSMSDLWFRDADRQLEGVDAYHNMLESIAGPLGGLVKNLYVGSQQFNEGHTWRGIETMLPSAAKNAMKAMRYESQGVNNLRGDPIVPDVSLPQALIQAIGFQPTKVADQQRINSALMNYQTFVQDRRQALMNAFAMANQAGDQEGTQDTIESIRKFNAKYPEIAITVKTLRASLRTRAQRSAQAENGIFLQKKLAGRIRQEVGASAGE